MWTSLYNKHYKAIASQEILKYFHVLSVGYKSAADSWAHAVFGISELMERIIYRNVSPYLVRMGNSDVSAPLHISTDVTASWSNNQRFMFFIKKNAFAVINAKY